MLTNRWRRPSTSSQAISGPPPRHGLEVMLGTFVGRSDVVPDLNDPLALLVGLEQCFTPATFDLAWIRQDGRDDEASRRFLMVTEHLRWGVPPVRFQDAWEIAKATDDLLGNRLSYAQGPWLGDVGAHSRLSSTTGRRGRLLSTIVRYTRPRTCIEIGTAYGLSSLFILAELRALGQGGHLATIEPWEPQLSLATSLLQRLHKDRVSCHGGTAQEVLPGLLAQLPPVDFAFHDGLHTGDAYRADFAALEPRLAPGAVVLIDDIRNESDTFGLGAPPRTYEGWTNVASHPRVRRAVEIDGSLGLLLLG